MFQIDKKFPSFFLEVYNPVRGEAGKTALEDFVKKWLILFFYPADFTFVCPTELKDLHGRKEDFKKIGAEVVVASTDTVFTHKAWLDSEGLLKDFQYQMAADHNGKFSRELGIYNEDIGMAHRAVFIIDPDGVLRGAEIVADTIGRNASETLRKLKALDFVRKNPGRVCPASWDEGAQTLQPHVSKAGKAYKELK